MRRLETTRLIIVAGLLSASLASAYEALQGPTELLFCDKEKTFSGYTFFGVGSRTFLLDMEGRVVHTWPIGTNPHLLDNGNIVDASKDDPSGFQGFKEVDWDGKTVWEYTEKRETYAPHHDWVRIFNKKINAPTTMYIANKTIGNDEAIAAGADPKKGPYRDGQMDAVVEVDMQGNVIWEWCFFDHVVQDIDPAKPNYVGPGKTIADHRGRININMPGRPLKRDWLHCNSMDYNAESGHIVINSVQGELYVIDHDGTFVAGDAKASIAKAASPAGDFLYRFGDPARYAQGDPPKVLENWDSATSGHKQMGGAHDAHWIRPGLAGAGHLMVFNNGQYLYQRTPQSSVLEFNPFLDANGRDTGKYVNPPDAGYRREVYDHDTHNQPRLISKQIVWSYRSVNSHGCFAHIGSSGQRLPNGNTFVCSDTEGHFFEVTSDGKLCWEYINPVTRDGAVKVLGDVLPMTNSAFRAYRYPADHPAFKGRDLAPKGTITERAAQGLDIRPRSGGGKDRQWPDDRGDGPSRPDDGQGRGGGGNRGGGGGGNRGGGGGGNRGGGGGSDGGGGRKGPRDDGQAEGSKPPRPDNSQVQGRVENAAPQATATSAGSIAIGNTLTKLMGGIQFGEGPTADVAGNVLFSDLIAGRTCLWSADGKLSTYRDDLGRTNGMWFDRDGNLIACEGRQGRLVSISADAAVTPLAVHYQGKRFNEPNDLWIAPSGGIYFTDPAYNSPVVQDGQHVYYLSPDRAKLTRVIGNMTKPNGLVGTEDGKRLYVSDHGAKRVWVYDISADGSLSNARLFAPFGADGITIDTAGNVYLAVDSILIFNPEGKQIETIATPEQPTNLCFGGKDAKVLYITTRPGLYAIQRQVAGVPKTRSAQTISAGAARPKSGQ